MARIWIDHKGSYVKINVTEDNPVETYNHGRTSEGHWGFAEKYSLEDGRILIERAEWGADCDGRYSQDWQGQWPIGGETQPAFVEQGPWVDGEGWTGIFDESIQLPQWETVDQSRRDYTAEAMGY